MSEHPPTLEQLLARAYAIGTGLRDDQTMGDLVQETRDRQFGALTLGTRRDQLAQVEARCIVSRVQREFLDRVLEP